ncbi:MAG: OadG family transporter subunit [Lachnospiraceae bacterium]|nr:OadG family transporter subunit [Lachnospiraceae bacterium]
MKKFKKILLACILTLTVLTLAACGSSNKTELTDQEQLHLEQTALQMAANIIMLEDEQIDMLIEQYEYEQNVPLANGFNSWKSAKKELGEFLGIGDGVGDTKIESDGSYTITIPLLFEKRECEFILGLESRFLKDSSGGIEYINQLTFNPVFSLGEKLSQAATNLVIGMGTVFVVLIFLAWVISLFKYVNKAEKKLEDKKKAKEAAKAEAAPAAKAAPAAAPAVKAAPAVQITPAPADEELQAVIAAAIAAYEEDEGCAIRKQPSLNNGIVVKSFKRG